MEIWLDSVTETDKKLLYRLLQYSLFEASGFDGIEMDKTGVFAYPYFENYFTDHDRVAFLIREIKSNQILGFVMINEYVQRIAKGHSIAEFMILPKYRRHKVGTKAARKCFDLFAGDWEVAPQTGSEVARLFWQKIIAAYAPNYQFKDQLFIFSR